MAHSLARPETELYLLVPAGSCPGHYDLAPSDALAIQRCDLALTHAFQTDLRTRWASLALPGALDVLADRGTALIPDNYRTGLADMAGLLARRYPRLAPKIRARHAAVDASIRTDTQAPLEALQRLGSGVGVVCDSRQAEFLRFLGLEVRGTWLAGADPSPELIRRPAGPVDLLVGNLQSDQSGITGRLAEQWGRPHVVLSNFPTDPAHHYDYLAYFQSQTRTLREALSHVRHTAR
jgi:zinc transport system substrate-binding protein